MQPINVSTAALSNISMWAGRYIPQEGLFYQGLRFGGIENLFYVALNLPFIYFLLSTTWAIEDTNLMHFTLAKPNEAYFEVEPMYFRLFDFIKGFAGISSIITPVDIYAADLSPWIAPLSLNLLIALMMFGLKHHDRVDVELHV